METKKSMETNEYKKSAGDRAWDVVWWFFAATMVPGGFMFVYLGERNELAFIMNNPILKWSLFMFGVIGSLCILYAEVRKRTKFFAMKKVFYTIITCIILFGIVAMIRL